MVKREKAQRLTEVLLDALSDLRRYAERIAPGELRSQRDIQNMVLHALYLAVQTTIDLGFHIGASEGLPRPTTYQQVFLQLGDAGILDGELARRLSGWAGLRNVLAHAYPTVDFDRVYRAMREELEDLEEFARQAKRLIASG